MHSIKKLVLLLGLSLVVTSPSWAVRPMHSSLALIAGYGVPGYQDGMFSEARFNEPLALAISPDGSKLYVSDTENNRVRMVNLDENYRVTTLVGNGKAGEEDGPFTRATLNHPKAMAYLPDDRLMVYDAGGKTLRLLDLRKGMVKTVTGGGAATLQVGPAGEVAVQEARNIVYFPAADSVVISQPSQAGLKMLDLKTWRVTEMFERQDMGRVSALCVYQGDLFLGVHDQTNVYRVSWKDGHPVAPVPVVRTMNPATALVGVGDRLYAFESGLATPFERLLPKQEPITLVSPAGDEIPSQVIAAFRGNRDGWDPQGLVADPRDDRRLIFTSSTSHLIASYRDLPGFPWAGGDGCNANGVDEPDYSAAKPPKTFRILVVGDSRSVMVVNYAFQPTWSTMLKGRTQPVPRQVSLCKRMEMELNMLAALEDRPSDFEVFSHSHSAAVPLFDWPAFGEVENAVKRSDMDLVVFMIPPSVSNNFPYKYYFERHLTAEGIPDLKVDSEFLLKPPSERVPEGPARRFYEKCKSGGWVKEEGVNLVFDEAAVLKASSLRPELVELYGRPIQLLSRRLGRLKTTSGKPVRWVVVTTHSGYSELWPEETDIWKAVCEQNGISFLDVNPDTAATQLSFYSLDENGSNEHYNPDGHRYFATVLSRALIRGGYLPWNK